MNVGHTGTVAIESEYPFLHNSQIKRCEGCNTKFVRVDMPMRKLADGTMFNPNTHCTKCETIIVNKAKANMEELQRFRITPTASEPRRQLTLGELARMDRECLRKDAFDSMGVARLVARRMRGRKGNHGAGAPVEAYRCTALIDPVRYPDRAKKHFHVGAVRHAPKL